MAAKRKPPPDWWLLGYLIQYQREELFKSLEELGQDPQVLYQAAEKSGQNLSPENYRRLAKAWAVRQHRIKKQKRVLINSTTV